MPSHFSLEDLVHKLPGGSETSKGKEGRGGHEQKAAACEALEAARAVFLAALDSLCCHGWDVMLILSPRGYA